MGWSAVGALALINIEQRVEPFVHRIASLRPLNRRFGLGPFLPPAAALHFQCQSGSGWIIKRQQQPSSPPIVCVCVCVTIDRILQALPKYSASGTLITLIGGLSLA